MQLELLAVVGVARRAVLVQVKGWQWSFQPAVKCRADVAVDYAVAMKDSEGNVFGAA